jgi:uncharacterized membrane protein
MVGPASPRMWRLVWHRRFDEASTVRTLGSGAVDRLAERVARSEQTHTGEIRISIEAGLPLSYLWRRATARQRAIALFGKLRVWDTEHNNGVLVYVLMAERAIEIVADRALARQVPQSQWDAITQDMASAFRAGNYEAGLQRAVEAVEHLLQVHCPALPGHRARNELSDRADLR